MRKHTPQVASFHKMVRLLEAILESGSRPSLSSIAGSLGVPVATAHRQATTLVSAGWLAPVARGRFVAGKRLLQLLGSLDEKQVLATAAAPLLDRLAAKTSCIAQLGTFENDMVTYRLKTGQGAGDLFTRVGMQLEAYCSAIGKVLLAHLQEDERIAYLASGPFVPLTPHTVTDPKALAEELERVQAQGFAEDREEVALGLRCLAVPVRNGNGEVIAAISVSRDARAARPARKVLQNAMLKTAQEIEAAMSARERQG
jgi:IclR family transcriptional regulator, acetate operon repressor